MHPKAIRNLPQLVPMSHTGKVDFLVSLSLALLPSEYLLQARPTHITILSDTLSDIDLILLLGLPSFFY